MGGLAQMVVGAVGALLIGTGLIAVLASNWDDFPRWVRIALALGPLAVTQAVAIAYLTGIAVWTIAQAAERGFGFADAVADVRLWYPLLLAGILPLWPGPELRDRPAAGSRLVLAASALLGLVAVAVYAAVQPRGPSLAFPWLAMLSAAAVLLFPLDRAGIAEPLACKPQVLLGGLALVVMALIATYEDPAHDFSRSVRPALGSGWCWLLLAVVAGFAFLGRQGAARIGAALIALLVILRMADADVSLLVKGLAFIVIGSGFLAFNAFVTRRRRVVAAGGSPA